MSPLLTPQSIVAAIGGHVTGNDRCAVPGPGHSRKDRSLSIKIDPTASGGFVCHSHSGDDGIVCKDYICGVLGIEWRTSPSDSKHRTSKNVTEYIYRQADGSPYLKVIRKADKNGFPQMRWNGKAWEPGKPDGPKIPYRLPGLLSAKNDDVLHRRGREGC